MTEVVFYSLAAFAVVSALFCITMRNPVVSAMWLVSTMFCLAAIYVLLHAQFIAAIQVLVYAGAVMVLFLFVIMLLNLGRDTGDHRKWPLWIITAGLVAGVAAPLAMLAGYSSDRLALDATGVPAFGGAASVLAAGDSLGAMIEAQGVVGVIAAPLFQTYLIPFEITSVLLLAAVVGAVVLAKRKI